MNESLDDGGEFSLLVHPRREPFEYGLLSIPKLIFTDGTVTLSLLKEKLLRRPVPAPHRVDAAALADALQISSSNADVALDTLLSVLPCDPQDSAVDVVDLVLFLYIQSYKKLLPKTHKDSPAVADVWPSTSAFDGYLSALTPLQLKRNNSRRYMPSSADEEAHQLSYLYKHMANIVALLADSFEGKGDDSLVLSLDSFQRLGLIIQFTENGREGIPIGQAAPFFVNSDADMPAVHISAGKVLEWLLLTINNTLEYIAAADKSPARESGQGSIYDVEVNMLDASSNSTKLQSNCTLNGSSEISNTINFRSQIIVEGIYKASVVKQASDIIENPVKVLNCHDSVIYILAPACYATVYGCSDATIVVGAVAKAIRVEHCERVQVITAAKRICIANCRECIFYLGVNQKPLILGDNHKLQVAPYNTFYAQLEDHMSKVRLDATINRWNEPRVLGMVDPHDSLSHPAGISDVPSESATCLDPDQFTNFLIPKWIGDESVPGTKSNPFCLPETYMIAQIKTHSVLSEIQEALKKVQLDANKKRDIACALHIHFKDWLYASGNIRQLYCLHGD
ncbi:hypothetical protein AXF42_Ash002695 [Apostasia shenzhenica]|uniref:TBCC domain-containing protein 1 n=1 Tax=Apostasia shenzhenica TaxID=1088818 RepID=A0A2I0A712_9ASPA|nr:hypothetical protein AXF42_Ash002695 [Apostasia shenzhenica]